MLLDREVAEVCVVADEKQDGLDRPAEPTEYSSIGQRLLNPLTFVVRTTVAPDAAFADIVLVPSGEHTLDVDVTEFA